METTITIPLYCAETHKYISSRKVMADVVGGLAVHRSIYDDDEWQITHVPTSKEICNRMFSRGDALAGRAAILPLADWAAIERLDPAAKKELSRQVRSLLSPYYFRMEIISETGTQIVTNVP